MVNGGVDKSVNEREWTLGGGDMLVMQGRTQQEWHHRVPKEKYRNPRININFRYILPDLNETSIRGVRTFYKYMLCGDSHTGDWEMTAPSFKYKDIVKKSGPMMSFFHQQGDGEGDSGRVKVKVKEEAGGVPCEAGGGADLKVDLAARRFDGEAGVVNGQEKENSNGTDVSVWQCPSCTYDNVVRRDAEFLQCEVCAGVVENQSYSSDRRGANDRDVYTENDPNTSSVQRKTNLLSFFAKIDGRHEGGAGPVAKKKK
jgi:hypothetical protein